LSVAFSNVSVTKNIIIFNFIIKIQWGSMSQGAAVEGDLIERCVVRHPLT